jgi:hypothetical protein
MTRHKNLRILATKYAQSARQSNITIQPRGFNWEKTLKIIFEHICYKQKSHITYLRTYMRRTFSI